MVCRRPNSTIQTALNAFRRQDEAQDLFRAPAPRPFRADEKFDMVQLREEAGHLFVLPIPCRSSWDKELTTRSMSRRKNLVDAVAYLEDGPLSS